KRFGVADHTCASTAMARAPSCVSTRMPSRTAIRHACRLPTPSMVTRHSKQTPIMQYGARFAPDTGVVRQYARPAASSAAATVSPSSAVMRAPLSVKAIVLPAASGSLLNMEPPGTEREKIVGEPACGNLRGDVERMVGGECHAGMAGREERAGMRHRLIVDREAVPAHHPQRRPGTHHVEAGEQWKHTHRAVSFRRGDRGSHDDLDGD